jgi:hypothetical protein
MSEQQHGGHGGPSDGNGTSGIPAGFAGGAGQAVPPAVTSTAPPGWYTLPDGRTAWWDGGQWQFQPPSTVPSQPYRSIDGLAKATVAMITLSGLVSLVVALTEVNRYRLMGRIVDGGFVSQSDADAADGLAAVASIIDLLVLVAAGIVFLVWLNRVFKNLHGPLRAGELDYSPGWAVGWWFIPFANFVKPKQVVNEAWKASDPGSPDPTVPPTHWRNRKPPALLSWWWAAWICAALISRLSVSWGGGDASTSPESLRTGFLLGAIGALLYVVAAVLAVTVVRTIADRHEARARNLAARGGWVA